MCREHGFECPVICTPEELMGEQVMARDPIVDEIRRVREHEAAKYGFDVTAILAASRKRQSRSKHKLVSFVRRKKLSA